MFTTTKEHWLEILPKIKEIYKDYNKKFSKFEGELREISSYYDDGEVQFIISDLRFYPFDNRSICKIECDDDNKVSYSISLPNHIYTDDEFDNVVDGLEKITSCRLFYENLIDEIAELF